MFESIAIRARLGPVLVWQRLPVLPLIDLLRPDQLNCWASFRDYLALHLNHDSGAHRCNHRSFLRTWNASSYRAQYLDSTSNSQNCLYQFVFHSYQRRRWIVIYPCSVFSTRGSGQISASTKVSSSRARLSSYQTRESRKDSSTPKPRGNHCR